MGESCICIAKGYSTLFYYAGKDEEILKYRQKLILYIMELVLTKDKINIGRIYENDCRRFDVLPEKPSKSVILYYRNIINYCKDLLAQAKQILGDTMDIVTYGFHCNSLELLLVCKGECNEGTLYNRSC